jgi:hypothetical protein
MNSDNDIDRFIKYPHLLIELCCNVIDEIVETPGSAETAEKEAQLLIIARTIDRLERSKVAVPDVFRAEKTKLAAAIEVQSESVRVLSNLATGFEEIVKELKSRLERHTSPGMTRRSKGPRSNMPKTSPEVLRINIIRALKKLGNRARVSDVFDEMERQLAGKLLPGDLAVRQDGKTIVWRNNAQWERLRMTRDGTLCSDSPNGIWELSEDHR